MTFAPKFDEPLLPKPRGKPVQVGDFDKFVLPVIRPEPSAVDLLAAVVDEEARKRVQQDGRFPKLMPSDIIGVQPMTNKTDPFGNFKFRIADGALFAKAKQGRSVFDQLPPSAVERLAGLEDARIAERNRKLDGVNGDLEQWRQTVEGATDNRITGELTIREGGKVTFQGKATLLDIRPNYDDLPPGVEMVEVDLG